MSVLEAERYRRLALVSACGTVASCARGVRAESDGPLDEQVYRRPRRTTDKARDESDGASDETVEQSDVPSSFVAEVEAGDESSGAVVVRVGFWMSPWTVYYLALRDRGAWRVVDYLSGNNRSKNVEDFVVAEVPLGRHRIWRVGWRDVSDGTWGNGPHVGADFSLAHSWIAFCSAAAPPFRALCDYDGLDARLECGCVQAPALCRYELGYEGSEAQEEVAAEVRIRPSGSVVFRPRTVHRPGAPGNRTARISVGLRAGEGI